MLFLFLPYFHRTPNSLIAAICEFSVLLEKNLNVFLSFCWGIYCYYFYFLIHLIQSKQDLLITDTVHSNCQKHAFTYSQPHIELITGTLKNLKGVLYCGIKSKFKDKLIGAGLWMRKDSGVSKSTSVWIPASFASLTSFVMLVRIFKFLSPVSLYRLLTHILNCFSSHPHIFMSISA